MRAGGCEVLEGGEGRRAGSRRGFFLVRSWFIVSSMERWSLLLALGTVWTQRKQ